MKLTIHGFENGGPIPAKFALGRPDPEAHVTLSDNVNPALQWSGVPEGTRSFALIVHDADVPTRPDDVNQEGRTVPHDLPRGEFFHWVLVDIPADARSIAEGSHAKGVTAHGKGPQAAPSPMRHGLNDYTGWFEGDADMQGQWFGYDGPCPPWNDERVHHYHFTLYALDVERLDVEGAFTGPDVRRAIEGHVRANAEWRGTYAIYDRAR